MPGATVLEGGNEHDSEHVRGALKGAARAGVEPQPPQKLRKAMWKNRPTFSHRKGALVLKQPFSHK